MASQERFELPTDGLEGRCSIQLSYWDIIMERVMRIELTTSAWKAEVLPLNYTRMFIMFRLQLLLPTGHVSSSASIALEWIRRDNSLLFHGCFARG